MEAHASNSLEYWISIQKPYERSLYPLRNRSHLKVAFDDGLIWVKGLSQKEINAGVVLSIPSVERYGHNKAKLYKYGKQLPSRIEPSVLWTPIERALPISLPKENFNFFGLTDEVSFNIIRSDQKRPVVGSIISISDLETYLKNAPLVRLASLKWCTLDTSTAIVLGSPLLPIEAKDFYAYGSFMLPIGFTLEHSVLVNVYSKVLSPEGRDIILIEKESRMTRIPRDRFVSLNRGSLRLTLKELK